MFFYLHLFAMPIFTQSKYNTNVIIIKSYLQQICTHTPCQLSDSDIYKPNSTLVVFKSPWYQFTPSTCVNLELMYTLKEGIQSKPIH